MNKVALTYDDIQLIPDYSEISSRKNIDLKTLITRRYGLKIPLVASPMDTVCESEMAIKLMEKGGLGVIHRFMSIGEQKEEVKKVAEVKKTLYEDWGVMYDDWLGEIKDIPVAASVGANGDYFERTQELIKEGVNIILIDVAHGHHINVKKAIENIKGLSSEIDVISGNIATAKAAMDLQDWGADGLRVGVGGGSLCTTRIKTGFGVPNVSCLMDIINVTSLPVMADGGIRSSGDIAKALGLGSSTIMLGSLIAGTQESPGDIINRSGLYGLYKKYRGAASLETKTTHRQEQRNVEGESTLIPYKGGVGPIVDDLLDGVRSALSYNGSNNLRQFNPDWVQVTSAGQTEAKPHLMK